MQTADSIALSKRARGGLGALGRWAAGGAVTAKSPDEEQQEEGRKTVATHRENVIFFLQQRLEEAGRVQSEMMEVRLGREVEKSKSVLYKSRMGGGIPYAYDDDTPDLSTPTSPGKRKRQSARFTDGYPDDEQPSRQGHELSQEQLQEYAEENAGLIKHYEDQLDQIKTAERSILEICQLHGTLMANIENQSENISQLVEDSYLTTENLGKGNKELKRASERRSTAQTLFYSTVAFCSFLVVWDLAF